MIHTKVYCVLQIICYVLVVVTDVDVVVIVVVVMLVVVVLVNTVVIFDDVSQSAVTIEIPRLPNSKVRIKVIKKVEH